MEKKTKIISIGDNMTKSNRYFKIPINIFLNNRLWALEDVKIRVSHLKMEVHRHIILYYTHIHDSTVVHTSMSNVGFGFYDAFVNYGKSCHTKI